MAKPQGHQIANLEIAIQIVAPGRQEQFLTKHRGHGAAIFTHMAMGPGDAAGMGPGDAAAAPYALSVSRGGHVSVIIGAPRTVGRAFQ